MVFKDLNLDKMVGFLTRRVYLTNLEIVSKKYIKF